MATTTRWTATRCLVAATLTSGLWLGGLGCGSSDSGGARPATASPAPIYVPTTPDRPGRFSSASLQRQMDRQQAQLTAQAGYRPPVRQVPRYVPVPPRYTQPYEGPMTYDPTLRRLVPAPRRPWYDGMTFPPAQAESPDDDAASPDYASFEGSEGTYDL